MHPQEGGAPAGRLLRSKSAESGGKLTAKAILNPMNIASKIIPGSKSSEIVFFGLF